MVNSCFHLETTKDLVKADCVFTVYKYKANKACLADSIHLLHGSQLDSLSSRKFTNAQEAITCTLWLVKVPNYILLGTLI